MASLSLLISLSAESSSLDILSEELTWGPDEQRQAQEFLTRGLPPLVSTLVLPFLFGVRPKFLAAMGHLPERYYRRFQVPKRGGGTRTIESPRTTLKVIQRWINDHILSRSEFSEAVCGFVRGKNIFNNGRPHAAGRNLMVIDITDFFPSIPLAKIAEVFNTYGFAEPVVKQLSALCSLEGRLPQGAPTSPAISNIVFASADRELEQLAASWQCRYTRYADDLAFSGARMLSSGDEQRVAAIFQGAGLSVNSRKTRRIGPGGRQIITGLIVNANALPPRWKRRRWRATFHRASRYPHEFQGRVAELRGIAAFVNQYDPELASRYFEIAGRVTA